MGADGIGPSTSSLSEKRSTTELRAPILIYFRLQNKSTAQNNFNIKRKQKQGENPCFCFINLTRNI